LASDAVCCCESLPRGSDSASSAAHAIFCEVNSSPFNVCQPLFWRIELRVRICLVLAWLLLLQASVPIPALGHAPHSAITTANRCYHLGVPPRLVDGGSCGLGTFEMLIFLLGNFESRGIPLVRYLRDRLSNALHLELTTFLPLDHPRWHRAKWKCQPARGVIHLHNAPLALVASTIIIIL